MKRPKLLRYPKTPKSGASVETLKRYEDKCREIRKKNEAKIRPYFIWKKTRESVLKVASAIKNKTFSHSGHAKKSHHSGKKKTHGKKGRRK